MKSFIYARFFAVLFFVALLLPLLSACSHAELETIRVAVFYDQNSGKAGEIDTTKINEYLEKKGKSYRLSVEQFTHLEKIKLSEYDLFLTDHYFTPTQLTSSFLDLTDDLRSGMLQPLYNAYPEIFWTTVLTDGRIYNLHGSTYPTIPVPLTYDEDLSFALASKYRFITPYIGISNSNMALQAICPYESSYMNEIKALIGDGNDLSSLANVHSAYARPALYGDQQTLIPQDAPHLDAVYALLNDIATDLELGVTCQSDRTPFTSSDPLSGGPALEKNWEVLQERFSHYQEGLLPKFSFDPSRVLTQAKNIDTAIQDWHSAHDPSELAPSSYENIEAWSAGWDDYINDFISMLYENGLQDVLDEVNRQVSHYIEEAQN